MLRSCGEFEKKLRTDYVFVLSLLKIALGYWENFNFLLLFLNSIFRVILPPFTKVVNFTNWKLSLL